MRSIAIGLLALALGVSACSADAPAPTPETTAAAERFATGDVLRYRFDWKVDSAAVTPILPDAMPMEAGMHLVGEVALRVLPRTAEHAVLGITIVRLDRNSITIMGQPGLASADELVGREIFATVSEDGEVLALHYARDTPSLAMHVVPGLLAQIDLRVPAKDGGAQQQRVPTGSGLADVEYAWTAPDRLARTLRSYARLDAFDAVDGADAQGQLTVELDARRLPVRIDATEELQTPVAVGEEQPFRSHATFTLERIGIDHDAAGEMPALDGLLQRDPNAPPDSAEGERALAQRFADGLDEAGMALLVHSAGAGLSPAPEDMVRAIGRLRGWPELAAELVPLFHGYESPRARSLIADMLASAGTPEAQGVLCDLLADPAVQSLPRRTAWIQRFAFVARPVPGTARFLLDEHERARSLGDGRSLQAVSYPMGSVARRIATTDPVAATALRMRLRETLTDAQDPALVVAALSGLGNAGAADDLEVVLEHERSELPDVRAAVAIALERQYDARASEALLRLVADSDRSVADAALTSLDGRGLAGDSMRLATVALSGSFVPELAGRLTSALVRRKDEPAVAAALLAMRTQTDDPTEHERIDATLSSAVSSPRPRR